jgi:hypothetical protein
VSAARKFRRRDTPGKPRRRQQGVTSFAAWAMNTPLTIEPRVQRLIARAARKRVQQKESEE